MKETQDCGRVWRRGGVGWEGGGEGEGWMRPSQTVFFQPLSQPAPSPKRKTLSSFLQSPSISFPHLLPVSFQITITHSLILLPHPHFIPDCSAMVSSKPAESSESSCGEDSCRCPAPSSTTRLTLRKLCSLCSLIAVLLHLGRGRWGRASQHRASVGHRGLMWSQRRGGEWGGCGGGGWGGRHG